MNETIFTIATRGECVIASDEDLGIVITAVIGSIYLHCYVTDGTHYRETEVRGYQERVKQIDKTVIDDANQWIRDIIEGEE